MDSALSPEPRRDTLRSVPLKLPRESLLAITAVAWGGVTVFGFSSPFFFTFVSLAGLHAIRTGLGWIGPGTRFLVRWRFVPVAAIAALTGNFWAAVGMFLLVAFNRSCIRAFLLSMAHANRPRLLTPMDVDQIVPPKIRYERTSGGHYHKRDGDR